MAAHFSCEMFGHFFYCPELGYEELGELEQTLRVSLSVMLEAHGAEHIEYREYGEALTVQCQFQTYSESAFQEFCAAIRDILTKDVDARFLFVDRENLDRAVFFAVTFEQGRHEERISLPRARDVWAASNRKTAKAAKTAQYKKNRKTPPSLS